MEPARQLFPSRDRRCLACEHEEGGLEGILRRVAVPQHAAADAQDHRPMAIHQGRKRSLRGLIIAGDKPLQKLLVAERPGRPAMEKRVQVPQYLTRRRARHRIVSRTLDLV